MAANDLVLKDQSSPAVPFAPECTDQGPNAAGVPVRRAMFGAADGALVTMGAKADAAWDGAAASASLVAILKAGVARLLGVGGATVPVSVANVSSLALSTVAASAAAQLLGATGAAGDFLGELLVVPTSTSPGAITIQDGTGAVVTVFAGGANSISNLVPFGIPLGVKSKAGGWKVTTGAGLSVVATGNFT